MVGTVFGIRSPTMRDSVDDGCSDEYMYDSEEEQEDEFEDGAELLVSAHAMSMSCAT